MSMHFFGFLRKIFYFIVVKYWLCLQILIFIDKEGILCAAVTNSYYLIWCYSPFVRFNIFRRSRSAWRRWCRLCSTSSWTTPTLTPPTLSPTTRPSKVSLSIQSSFIEIIFCFFSAFAILLFSRTININQSIICPWGNSQMTSRNEGGPLLFVQ